MRVPGPGVSPPGCLSRSPPLQRTGPAPARPPPGRLSNEMMNRILHELDLEESRLEI